MKIILLFLTFSCLTFGVIQAQTYVYDGQGNIIGGSHIKFRPGNELKITDPLNNNYYILDSSHIYITAYNKAGQKFGKPTHIKTARWKNIE
jgi:hypothetical protein